jgi:hypothetical protein
LATVRRAMVMPFSATISAQLVDTNGNMNVARGEVERNGRFWVDNLPLSGGTSLSRHTHLCFLPPSSDFG